MSATRFATAIAVIVAAQAALFGLVSGNPNWLVLNIPIGLAAGYLLGLLMWPLALWIIAQIEDQDRGQR